MVITPKYLWTSAVTIGPFILIRERNYSKTILNHEYIHYKQQLELLFIFAYLVYVIEFIIKFIYYRFDLRIAYKNISFEREAYSMQNVIGYCGHRKPYSWVQLMYIPKIKK